MIDDRPRGDGRLLRRGRTAPRRDGASLIKDRFRRATRHGGAPYAFAVLHQVIVLLEVIQDLADLIGLRVKATHHLAFLRQLVLTLLQGKHVQQLRICTLAEILPGRRDFGADRSTPGGPPLGAHPQMITLK